MTQPHDGSHLDLLDRPEHVLRTNRLLLRELVGVVREVADEDGGGLGEREEGVLLDRSVGGENAPGETGDEGAGEEEVLSSTRRGWS